MYSGQAALVSFELGRSVAGVRSNLVRLALLLLLCFSVGFGEGGERAAATAAAAAWVGAVVQRAEKWTVPRRETEGGTQVGVLESNVRAVHLILLAPDEATDALRCLHERNGSGMEKEGVPGAWEGRGVVMILGRYDIAIEGGPGWLLDTERQKKQGPAPGPLELPWQAKLLAGWLPAGRGKGREPALCVHVRGDNFENCIGLLHNQAKLAHHGVVDAFACNAWQSAFSLVAGPRPHPVLRPCLVPQRGAKRRMPFWEKDGVQVQCLGGTTTYSYLLRCNLAAQEQCYSLQLKSMFLFASCDATAFKVVFGASPIQRQTVHPRDEHGTQTRMVLVSCTKSETTWRIFSKTPNPIDDCPENGQAWSRLLSGSNMNPPIELIRKGLMCKQLVRIAKGGNFDQRLRLQSSTSERSTPSANCASNLLRWKQSKPVGRGRVMTCVGSQRGREVGSWRPNGRRAGGTASHTPSMRPPYKVR
ncbi:hypothetical protein B0T16DRAFT_389624 [Cercophora newfieldiana]|uniref:Uncharacterized protein n=1 Tax=Cercophora newfieldiana TaxID=92897 RepID=A0AA39YBJ6_9PEZI|nr:hypothetical protein B0T16DRAFT_389624 [Cercophora newfieldiana]